MDLVWNPSPALNPPPSPTFLHPFSSPAWKPPPSPTYLPHFEVESTVVFIESNDTLLSFCFIPFCNSLKALNNWSNLSSTFFSKLSYLAFLSSKTAYNCWNFFSKSKSCPIDLVFMKRKQLALILLVTWKLLNNEGNERERVKIENEIDYFLLLKQLGQLEMANLHKMLLHFSSYHLIALN
jgi:hypothetical protein